MDQRRDSSTVPIESVLIIGASGSIGRHAVAEAVRAGLDTRALVRDPAQAAQFNDLGSDVAGGAVEVVVGDFTRPDTLTAAVDGVDAVVFTHGTYGDAAAAEQVNYGAVRNVLSVLTRPVRVALMTTVGVTKPSAGHDWKRRGERLVRASGLPYTIVRPGWFDHNAPDEHRLVMRQGDTRWAGDPSDGVISREQIAAILIASLTHDAADHKTFELVAEKGEAPAVLTPLFAALQADDDAGLDGLLDGPGDRDNLPLAAEPARVINDLDAIRSRF